MDTYGDTTPTSSTRPRPPDHAGAEGFTLIELLTTVIVVAVLAVIAIPVFLTQRDRAQESAVQSDLRNAGVMQMTDLHDGEAPALTLAELEDRGFNLSAGVQIVNPTDFSYGDGGFCMAGRAENGSTVWSVNSVNGTVMPVAEPC